tara:strand:- start:129 stop:803 length:675 start_codon:yes stop_codon:yes gene_type:complete
MGEPAQSGKGGFVTWRQVSAAACALAVAIAEAVFATAAAATVQCSPQGLARAVQPNSHIRRCDAEIRRDFFARVTRQIDPPQNLRIVWAERRQQTTEAIADALAQLKVVAVIAKQSLFLRVIGLTALPGALASIMVHEHRSEHAVEPGNHAFAVSQLCSLSDDAQTEALKHVLRGALVSEPTDEELQKSPMIIGKRRLDHRAHRSQSLVRLAAGSVMFDLIDLR